MKYSISKQKDLQIPTIISELTHELASPLPGFEAQHTMAPKLRYKNFEFDNDKSSARLSSVLIPLYFKNNELFTVLTQRHDYKGVHSRQVSFPGGKMESSDPDLKFTALREACEEVNICEQEVEVLGQLTELYIPPSNFLVSPYVAYLQNEPTLIPEQSEVAEIIEVPVKQFLKQETIKTKVIHLANGMHSDTPYFDIKGKVVWGATAMILGEFVEILKKIVTIDQNGLLLLKSNK